MENINVLDQVSKKIDILNKVEGCPICKKGKINIIPLLCKEKIDVIKSFDDNCNPSVINNDVNILYIPCYCNNCGFLSKHQAVKK
jgi:predicted Zn-ribbon and HTH transcriptional regulator